MTNLETQEIIIQDGYRIDAETGEVLGLAEPFQVTDVKSAEWVMEKMFDAESKARAYEAQAQGILDNLAKLTKAHRSKAEWLKTCYGNQIEEVAKANLPKGKKTWTSLFGSVAFRVTKAKIEVEDTELAIGWAKAYYPDAVKVTESLLKSELPPVVLQDLMTTDGIANSGLTYVPEGESVTIKVGA